MKTFLISYDLGIPESRSEYILLVNHIKVISIRWARPLKSVWIIKSDMNAGQIRDSIRNKIDLNDRLMVIEISGGWGTYNISREVTEWMQLNI